MMAIRPRIRRGDLVLIVSPSAPLAGQFPDRAHRGVRALAGLDLRVRLAPHALEMSGHVSASAEERAADLNEGFCDPEVRAIVATVGGWNSNGLLDHLDFEALRADPKVVCGYSDVTAIVLGLWQHTGVTTFVGPALLPQFGEAPTPHTFTLAAWRTAVGLDPWPTELSASPVWTSDRQPWDELEPPTRTYRAAAGPRVLRHGRCSGPLIAGHLSTVCALIGTQHCPDFTDAVLWLEQEEGGLIGALERDLVHLEQAGVLGVVGAVIFGRFTDAEQAALHDAVILDATDRVTGPIVVDADFGHTDPILTLPIGVIIEVEASSKGVTPSFLMSNDDSTR